jgi:hypothetical protein
MDWKESPRMALIWQVLEGARDAGDKHVIDACVRLIDADRLGWRRHHRQEDWQVVKAFSEG